MEGQMGTETRYAKLLGDGGWYECGRIWRTPDGRRAAGFREQEVPAGRAGFSMADRWVNGLVGDDALVPEPA